MAFFQTCIPGSSLPGIILMDHSDPAIQGSILIAHFSAAVRRTVIHQNNFKISIGLCQNAPDAAVKIWFNLVNRYDYTHHLYLMSPAAIIYSEIPSAFIKYCLALFLSAAISFSAFWTSDCMDISLIPYGMLFFSAWKAVRISLILPSSMPLMT